MATGKLEDNSSLQEDGHPDFVLISSDYVPSQKEHFKPRKPEIADGLDFGENHRITFGDRDGAMSLISADNDLLTAQSNQPKTQQQQTDEEVHTPEKPGKPQSTLTVAGISQATSA